MRLYSSRVSMCAQEIVRRLIEHGDIEVSEVAEAQLDVESVLREYLRVEREINDKARDLLDKRGLPREQYGRIKRLLAEERGFGLGEEAVGWISNQIIELFMHSSHIAEVFADDGALRVHMRDVLRKHMQEDEEIEAEARKRLQHLQEGTSVWEIEYERAKDAIRRARGLE